MNHNQSYDTGVRQQAQEQAISVVSWIIKLSIQCVLRSAAGRVRDAEGACGVLATHNQVEATKKRRAAAWEQEAWSVDGEASRRRHKPLRVDIFYSFRKSLIIPPGKEISMPMRFLSILLWTLAAPALTLSPRSLGSTRFRSIPVVPQRARLLRAQQGPLEEGYGGLLPGRTEEGNIDPEIVERMDAEVFSLTGVGLEDLLNPSKVVNLERERLLLESQLETCQDIAEKAELKEKLTKVEQKLYSEKRVVFAGWLKNVFIGQALLSIAVGGVAAFDAFPTVTIDISLRALGFWSYWLFTIPSLRARRPKGWEKKALNIAFLGSPLLTFAAPFATKDTGLIWTANLIFLVGCYAYGASPPPRVHPPHSPLPHVRPPSHPSSSTYHAHAVAPPQPA